MKKVVYDLGKIGLQISLKLCIIIEEAPIGNRLPGKSYTIDKSIYGGNETIRYTPRPFITMTIEDYENGVKVRGSQPVSINLNRVNIFSLICAIRKFIRNYNEMPIYQYYNGRLCLNSEVTYKAQVTVNLTTNGIISMLPTIVNPTEGVDSAKEAVQFSINNSSTFALIDISELKYLLWKLETLNVEAIAATLVSNNDHAPTREIQSRASEEMDNYERVTNASNSYMNMQMTNPLINDSRIPDFH